MVYCATELKCFVSIFVYSCWYKIVKIKIATKQMDGEPAKEEVKKKQKQKEAVAQKK